MEKVTDAPKRAQYVRRAGGGLGCRPVMPEFTIEKGIEELVPSPTVMAAYKLVAESAYRAVAMCEEEDEVYILCLHYLIAYSNMSHARSSDYATCVSGRATPSP